MSSIPKAVLYYSTDSVWSSVVRLTLEEKGYGEDEIVFRAVDLSKGENYDLTFLRLNPQATVPTLLVPYENSLTEDVESRYKAVTDTKAIVEFLDKSRSPLSRTHTTSSAPAPSLTPATIESTTTAKVIIEEILHSEIADPEKLVYVSARDEEGLRALAKEQVGALRQVEAVLVRNLASAEEGSVRVSAKVKALWGAKLESVRGLLGVFSDAERSGAELDGATREARGEYFARVRRVWEVELGEVVTRLGKEIVGPLALGDQISVADLHVAGWLARVVRLAGGAAADSGEAVVRLLGARTGAVEEGLGLLWDGLRARASWQKIYGAGLV